MQALEQANERAADLYWLAFVFTGERERSLDVATEALGFQDGGNPFFSTWMRGWSRRLVIARALAAIRDELARSARRTASQPVEKPALPPRNWPERDTTKVEFERALLAIDVFPTCALLLSVFEGVSVEDTAILLDADSDLVRKARMIGMRELAGNVALIPGSDIHCNEIIRRVTSEMQYA